MPAAAAAAALAAAASATPSTGSLRRGDWWRDGAAERGEGGKVSISRPVVASGPGMALLSLRGEAVGGERSPASNRSSISEIWSSCCSSFSPFQPLRPLPPASEGAGDERVGSVDTLSIPEIEISDEVRFIEPSVRDRRDARVSGPWPPPPPPPALPLSARVDELPGAPCGKAWALSFETFVSMEADVAWKHCTLPRESRNGSMRSG